MNGPRGYYAKCNKPDRERQTPYNFIYIWKLSVSSVTQSCLTLCDPMDCSTLGFPVLHYLPEFAQTHVH